MERKVGEIFKYHGEWYQCAKAKICSCVGCAFYSEVCCTSDFFSIFGKCKAGNRSDSNFVIFKKLEKVGEPFERNGYMYQEYKTHIYPLLMSGDAKIPTTNGFAVIIKQNKEDMKTVKISKDDFNFLVNKIRYGILPKHTTYDEITNEISNLFSVDDTKHSNSEKIGKNLKEFNLEAAKSGKSVCTRSGKPVRIICFDKITRKNYEEFKIIALVRDKDNEDIHVYNNKGRKYLDDSSVDLMMLPEKKEGWVNLYRDEESKRVYCGESIFSEREKAEKHYECNDTKVATVSIGWEE